MKPVLSRDDMLTIMNRLISDPSVVIKPNILICPPTPLTVIDAFDPDVVYREMSDGTVWKGTRLYEPDGPDWTPVISEPL